MRRIREFAGQILAREVELLVQVRPPFGTIGHIINNAVIGDQFRVPRSPVLRRSSISVTMRSGMFMEGIIQGASTCKEKSPAERAGDFFIC